MHYVSHHGRHVEIDLTPRVEYVLAGREPRILTPLEVAKQYTPADERRRHQRRKHGEHNNVGRRHRDHTSQAQDAYFAALCEKVRDAKALRARISGETRVQDEAA